MKYFKYNLGFLLGLPLIFAFSLIVDINWFLGASEKLTRLNAVPSKKLEVVKEYVEREDWVIAYGPFGQTDLNLYYENRFKLHRYIRRANVVFLGNSRSQFAYNRFAIEAFFERHNIDFYHLGFGCNERISIELNLLKKRRASPQIFILNVDNGFFDKYPSHCAAQLLDGTDLGQRRLFQSRILQGMMFYANSALAQLGFDRAYLPEKTLYRQIGNGLWVTDIFTDPYQPHELQRVEPIKCKPLSDPEKKLIDGWIKEIKRTSPNSLIINTHIPKSRFCEGRLREVSEYMNVSYFQVEDLSKLTVFDGSHLSKESAELFTREFTNFFETQILPTADLSSKNKQRSSRQ